MTDHADKSQYRSTPKHKPLALLFWWHVQRFLIQWALNRLESDTEYWVDMERYAIHRQRENMQKSADGRAQLKEAQRMIEGLS